MSSSVALEQSQNSAAKFATYLFWCDHPNPAERRRGAILGAILAVMVVAAFASLAVFIAEGTTLRDCASDFAAMIAAILIFYDNRRGHVQRSSFVTLALQLLYVTFFNAFLATEPVAHLIGGFMWVVPTFFAAALMNWRIASLASIYCIVNAWFFQHLFLQNATPLYDTPWEIRTLTLMFILVVTAMFCVILRYQTDRYEAEVTTRNAELNQVNSRLESEVERRTKEAILARDAAVNANRAKSEFLVNMSHELRTPLHSVLGNADLLLDSGLVEHQLELANNTRSSGAALLTLLDDILEYSNLDLGAAKLDEHAFDVRQWQAKVLAPLVAAAKAKNLSITVEIAPDVPQGIRADSNHLRRILVNLANNAIKFTDQGEVTISLHVREFNHDRVLLEWQVRDTGVGIARENQERLFDVFEQGDASLQRRAGGIGLGLGLCKRLAERMGGTIHVESQVQQGSTFTFLLPVQAAEAGETIFPEKPDVPQSRISSASDSVQPATNGRRILVVDDTIMNQKVAVLMLRKLGYDPDVVDNGADAVRTTRERHYDIILMDVQMPEMDGLEATRRILAQADVKCRPIIIGFTAHNLPQDQAQCYAAGMSDIVTKPTELSTLQSAVDRAVAKLRANGA